MTRIAALVICLVVALPVAQAQRWDADARGRIAKAFTALGGYDIFKQMATLCILDSGRYITVTRGWGVGNVIAEAVTLGDGSLRIVTAMKPMSPSNLSVETRACTVGLLALLSRNRLAEEVSPRAFIEMNDTIKVSVSRGFPIENQPGHFYLCSYSDPAVWMDRSYRVMAADGEATLYRWLERRLASERRRRTASR